MLLLLSIFKYIGSSFTHLSGKSHKQKHAHEAVMSQKTSVSISHRTKCQLKYISLLNKKNLSWSEPYNLVVSNKRQIEIWNLSLLVDKKVSEY